MRKSVLITAAAGALVLAGTGFVAMTNHDAAAQSTPVYVNAVDLDIAPAEMEKFLALAKENGENPNHVFFYEVYDNEAALTAHRATAHFKEYQAATANMVTGRNVRGMTGIAFNTKAN
jgi:hypothetical protein